MVAISTLYTPLPTGSGDSLSLFLMLQIVTNLFQEFLVGTKVSRLLVLSKQTEVLVGSLSEHKGTTGRDLKRSRRVQVTIHLAKKAEVDSRGADGFGVIVVIKWTILDNEVGMMSRQAVPTTTPPNSYSHPILS